MLKKSVLHNFYICDCRCKSHSKFKIPPHGVRSRTTQSKIALSLDRVIIGSANNVNLFFVLSLFVVFEYLCNFNISMALPFSLTPLLMRPEIKPIKILFLFYISVCFLFYFECFCNLSHFPHMRPANFTYVVNHDLLSYIFYELLILVILIIIALIYAAYRVIRNTRFVNFHTCLNCMPSYLTVKYADFDLLYLLFLVTVYTCMIEGHI